MATIDLVVPRSYLDTNDVSAGRRARVEALERYDLSSITNNLIDKGRYFSPEQIWPLRDYFGRVDGEIAGLLEREFRRFVAVTILEPGYMYAPPGALDMYWHFFVLHTRDYARFCGEVWGTAHDHGALPKDIDDTRSPAPMPILPHADTIVLVQDISLVSQEIVSGLKEEDIRKIYILEHWDLSFFTDRLVEVEAAEGNGRRFSPEQAWPIVAHFGTASREVAKAIEEEFKRFIILTLLDESRAVVTSGSIDMYLHFLILHTKEYREFCNAMWGRFRHYPFVSLTDTSDVTIKEDFMRTTSFYRTIFGAMDEHMWCDPTLELVA